MYAQKLGLSMHKMGYLEWVFQVFSVGIAFSIKLVAQNLTQLCVQ